MNLFIIPSWYPSESYPSTGIFFREQSILLARHLPRYQVGISLWGSHEPKLWLRKSKPLHSLIQYISKPLIKPHENLLEPNCIEFFHPAYTWTRKIKKGNLQGIITANMRNFERYIRHFGRPELIHAHVAFPAGYIARVLAQKYQLPYVITEHMSPFPMPSLKRELKRKILPVLNDAAAVFAVSQALSDRLVAFGIKSQRTSNFIDDSFFTPGPGTNGIFTLVSIGRLEKQKGFELLIEAMGLLRDEGFPVQLRILGDGPMKRLLLQLAIRRGVSEQITWLGEADRFTVRNELQQAHAFVLASVHENQPVAILEAMACGLPVITTGWHGASELVDARNGSIVRHRSPEALAEEIKNVRNTAYEKPTLRELFLKRFGTEKVILDLSKRLETVRAGATR